MWYLKKKERRLKVPTRKRKTDFQHLCLSALTAGTIVYIELHTKDPQLYWKKRGCIFSNVKIKWNTGSTYIPFPHKHSKMEREESEKKNMKKSALPQKQILAKCNEHGKQILYNYWRKILCSAMLWSNTPSIIHEQMLLLNKNLRMIIRWKTSFRKQME